MAEIVLTPAIGDAWLAERRPVYLIHGEDGLAISEAVQSAATRWVRPEDADFDLDELDAEVVSVGDILGSLSREPMLGDVRLVIVRSSEVFRRRERNRDAEALAAGIGRVRRRSTLVLVKRAEDPGGRKAATVLTPKLDAAVREHGTMVRCPALDASAMAEWAARYVSQSGKRIGPDAVRRLTAQGGEDRTSFRLELNKLISFVGARDEIRLSDVEATLTHDPEDVMFRLVDAVTARRAGEALTLLRAAARYESKAQTLAGRFLSLLSRQLRFVYQARELTTLGLNAGNPRSLPAQIAADLPSDGSITSMAWKARAYARDAGQWCREDLVRALGAIMDCDAANKGDESGSEDALGNLEVLIVRLCDPSAR